MGCDVLGVDASRAQVEAAGQRGLDVFAVDGEDLRFDGEFDAVFSNAALHWMKRPARVIDGVWRALRPGGRFVGEFGGAGCIAQIRAALARALAHRSLNADTADPWYFPTAEEYRAHLETRGFVVTHIVLFPRPTPLPGDIVEWLETFARSFLSLVPVAERASLLEEVRGSLHDALCDGDGRWTADYVRLRFAATRPRGSTEGSGRRSQRSRVG